MFCEEGVEVRLRRPARRSAPAEAWIERAAEADKFTGKSGSALDIVAPSGLDGRAALVVIGVGKGGRAQEPGLPSSSAASAMGKVPSRRPRPPQSSPELSGGCAEAGPGGRAGARHAARAPMSFDRYKTKRKEGEEAPVEAAGHHRGGRRARRRKKALGQSREAVADGVHAWRAT